MATLAADTASTTTTYTDATATGEGETYAYRVKAIRGEARSQGSNRVSLVPVEPPATPENLKPTNLTFEIREDGVTLAWDAPGRRRRLRDRLPGGAPPPQPGRERVAGVEVGHRLHRDHLPGWVRPGPTGSTTCTGCAPCAGTTTARCQTAWTCGGPKTTPQTAEWAPSNLQAQMYFEVALGEEGVTSQVKLTWDASGRGRPNGSGATRCSGPPATAASPPWQPTPAPRTPPTPTPGVEAGESYTYRVRRPGAPRG